MVTVFPLISHRLIINSVLFCYTVLDPAAERMNPLQWQHWARSQFNYKCILLFIHYSHLRHWSLNQTMTHTFNSSLFHLCSQNHNHIASVGFTIWRVNDILRPETLDSREEKLPRHNKKKNLETGRKNMEETSMRDKQFTVILSKASWNVLYIWFTITWTNHAFIVLLTHCWQPLRAFIRACYGHFVWNHLNVLFLYYI